MLSRVVSRADAGKIHGAVFPQLTGYDRGAAGLDSCVEPKRNTDESAGVRERLQQIEAQSASDRREAFEAGKHEGEQQARAELQPVLERLNSSITQILGMRPDLRRRAEGDAVELALLIAKRVLHRQLSVDEGALTAIAHVAFERLTRSESYRITVHPQFAAAVTAALPGAHAARVQIDADPNCALGTLIIQSAEGTIDASADAQLEEIKRGLTDRLANA